MLPDFASIKDILLKLSQIDMKHQIINSSHILSHARYSHNIEGNRMRMIYEDGSEEPSSYQKISAERIIDNDDIINRGFDSIADANKEIAREFQMKQETLLFEKIKSSSETHGNVIDGRGREMTSDILLDFYGKLDYDFDDLGNITNSYAFYVSPDVAERFRIRIAAIHEEIKFTEKFNALMEQKKREFNDRESNRKLVD